MRETNNPSSQTKKSPVSFFLESFLRTLTRLILHQTKKRENEDCYEFEINIFFDNTFDSKNSHDHQNDLLDEDIHQWKSVNMWVGWFSQGV